MLLKMWRNNFDYFVLGLNGRGGGRRKLLRPRLRHPDEEEEEVAELLNTWRMKWTTLDRRTRRNAQGGKRSKTKEKD